MKLVYTGTQIRNAERPYLEAPDYDGYLMQRAADALAAEAHDMLADAGQHSQYTRILLLVGPGNNGADTVYAGTRLHQQGYRIEAVLFDPTGNNLELLARESGEGTRVLDTAQSLRDIASYSLIIDGILGTGAKGAARGEAGSTWLNSVPCRWTVNYPQCSPVIPRPGSIVNAAPCTNPHSRLRERSRLLGVSYRQEPILRSTAELLNSTI